MNLAIRKLISNDIPPANPAPKKTTPNIRHYPAIIVGGGQSGLSASYYLKQLGIEHLVLEKHCATHAWRHRRWDVFSLVTPNWQCNLPGYPYAGNDPHGFMKRDEIIDYLDGFIQSLQPPLIEDIDVTHVSALTGGGFHLQTSKGDYSTNQVIVASGGYHTPIIPTFSSQLPPQITQLHSEQYRNPQSLPKGAVLVVGSGQSGAQIAEDLHLAGRKVYLATGDAPRCARFYRGRDVVDWLADMGYYDLSVSEHPLREGVRDNTNHYVTGRDGGRDIDLRVFAQQGMELFGRLEHLHGNELHFLPNLKSNLDNADAAYNRINRSIDQYIEQQGIIAEPASTYQPIWEPLQERTTLNLTSTDITTIIWCIGFRPDFSWVKVPIFNQHGYPEHSRGITAQSGLYFLGLPWLHTWGSGRFSGIARDAEHIAQHIYAQESIQPTQSAYNVAT